MGEKCRISPAMEDYLRIIYSLEIRGEKPTVTLIARNLNVKKPTVTHALKVLKEAGYISYNPYGSVKITEEGKKRAEDIVRVHELLLTFFNEILGVDIDESEREACLVEHCLSKATIERLAFFVKNYLSQKKY